FSIRRVGTAHQILLKDRVNHRPHPSQVNTISISVPGGTGGLPTSVPRPAPLSKPPVSPAEPLYVDLIMESPSCLRSVPSQQKTLSCPCHPPLSGLAECWWAVPTRRRRVFLMSPRYLSDRRHAAGLRNWGLRLEFLKVPKLNKNFSGPRPWCI